MDGHTTYPRFTTSVVVTIIQGFLTVPIISELFDLMIFPLAKNLLLFLEIIVKLF